MSVLLVQQLCVGQHGGSGPFSALCLSSASTSRALRAGERGACGAHLALFPAVVEGAWVLLPRPRRRARPRGRLFTRVQLAPQESVCSSAILLGEEGSVACAAPGTGRDSRLGRGPGAKDKGARDGGWSVQTLN